MVWFLGDYYVYLEFLWRGKNKQIIVETQCNFLESLNDFLKPTQYVLQHLIFLYLIFSKIY